MFNLNNIYFYSLLAFAFCNGANVPQPLNPVYYGANNTKPSSIEDTESEESNEEGGKIVGGQTTTIDKFPYEVSVLYRGQPICAGTIISKYYVATAAHCSYGYSSYEMAITYASSYRGVGIYNPVYEKYEHPDYNPTTLDADVAVFKFLTPIAFSSYAQPIGLCTNEVPQGGVGTISGWGSTVSGQDSPSTQLQYSIVPRISQGNCRVVLGSAAITQNMLCAGWDNGGTNVCQGDGGAPFVYNNQLCGIASWNDGTCAQPNDPAVFADVFVLSGFILGVTGLPN